MKKSSMVLWLIVLLVVAGVPALGAGFGINEQGTRAMGQAGAFAARANDPSAVFFNPAGITQLLGTQFYFGGTAIAQTSTWDDPAQGLSIDSIDKVEFPPHFYMTQQLNDRIYFGLGVFAPYGLGKMWPENFPGKYENKMTNLRNICINPNIAFKLSDKISVAIGVDYLHSTAKLDRALYLQPLSDQLFGGMPLGDGYFSADVSDNAWGWNAGVRAQLTDNLFFGAGYRSQIKLNLDGYLTLTVPQTGIPTVDGTLSALFPSQAASTSITLPDNLYVGLGGNVTERFSSEVDFQWVNWKDFKELPFNFSVQTPVLQDSATPKNWNDGWAVRWGNEYHYSDSIDFRFGFYYDATPIPDATLDPILPGSDRYSFQLGYGWHNEHWTLDFAYMFLGFTNRDINPNPAYGIIPDTGTYKNHAHLFGLSMGYRF